jgi:hypothetical protein
MELRAYRRFLILSSPRCGTYMLWTSFAHHPTVVAHTELFNPDWNPNEPFDETTPTDRRREGRTRAGRATPPDSGDDRHQQPPARVPPCPFQLPF